MKLEVSVQQHLKELGTAKDITATIQDPNLRHTLEVIDGMLEVRDIQWPLRVSTVSTGGLSFITQQLGRKAQDARRLFGNARTHSVVQADIHMNPNKVPVYVYQKPHVFALTTFAFVANDNWTRENVKSVAWWQEVVTNARIAIGDSSLQDFIHDPQPENPELTNQMPRAKAGDVIKEVRPKPSTILTEWDPGRLKEVSEQLRTKDGLSGVSHAAVPKGVIDAVLMIIRGRPLDTDGPMEEVITNKQLIDALSQVEKLFGVNPRFTNLDILSKAVKAQRDKRKQRQNT